MKYNVKRMTWKTAVQEAKPDFPNRVCIYFLSLLSLFSSPSPPLVSSWGVHRLGQLDSRRGLRDPCSQIACNFIFVCKYVFLVRCVAGEKKKKKNRRADISDKQLHLQLVWEADRDELWSAGGAEDWILRRQRRKWPEGNTGETPTGTWVLFYSNACVVDWARLE